MWGTEAENGLPKAIDVAGAGVLIRPLELGLPAQPAGFVLLFALLLLHRALQPWRSAQGLGVGNRLRPIPFPVSAE